MLTETHSGCSKRRRNAFSRGRPSPSLSQLKLRDISKSLCTLKKAKVPLQTQHSTPSQNIPSQFFSRDPQLQIYYPLIKSHYCSIETIQKPEILKGITADMRVILQEWLIQVHQSFGLKEDTLYLGLRYLNMYSSMCTIARKEYQLVGITCLWIASKYEEIHPPKPNNYTYSTCDAYTVSEMKKMEQKILIVLNFQLCQPTILQLLNLHLESCSQNRKYASLCRYILQMAVIENKIKTYSYQCLVQSIIMVGRIILQLPKPIEQPLYSKSSQRYLCMKQICQMYKTGRLKYSALLKKYAQERFMRVGTLKLQKKL